MLPRSRLAVLLLLACASASPSRASLDAGTEGASCSPQWIPTFGGRPGVGPGPFRAVLAFATHDDGSGPALMVGGSFLIAGSVPTGSVARWDGADWSGLPLGLDTHALAVFDDGTGPALYAAGSFASGVSKWDGADWVTVGGGLDHDAFALAVFDDGGGPALYAGGRFTSANGMAASRIARWDGASWQEVGGGVNGAVWALAVHDDGGGPALFVGGKFGMAGTVAASRVARWDGTSWSALGSGVDAQVNALCVFDDGGGPALYAGGIFGAAGGAPASRVASWDGASWSGLATGLDDDVDALAAYDDGSGPRLYVGGDFSSAGGVAAAYLAAWDGVGWSAVAGGIEGRVRALAVHDDGSGAGLYVGGEFLSAGGRIVNDVARWDGSWSALGDGPTHVISVLETCNDGTGPALFANGGPGEVADAGRIRRWDGAAWSLLPGSFDASNDNVRALAGIDVGGGPALYVGGIFAGVGPVAASNIARWDGAFWSPLGAGTSGPVHALVEFDDGSGPALYAGGSFLSAGGAIAGRIAKWDGASWSAVGAGLDGPVYALAVHDAGSGPALYAGGSGVVAGGMQTGDVGRWDGTGWSAVGDLHGGAVRDLLVHDFGTGARLFASGSFLIGAGIDPQVVARLNVTTWFSMSLGLSSAGELASYDDGNGPALYTLIANPSSGTFPTVVKSTGGPGWSQLPNGLSHGGAFCLAVFDDGRGAGDALFLGGSFLAMPASGDSYIARWGGCSAAPVTYCTGKTSSLGCVPFVSTVGVPSASRTTPFEIVASDAIDGEFGLVLYGFQKANLSFHGGKLCVKAPVFRLLPPKAAKGTGPPPCTGVARRNFQSHIQSGANPALSAGQTVRAQWLLRDPADPLGFGDSLTDAVQFTVGP